MGIVRNKDPWHRLTIHDEGELILVGTGRRAYLWAGPRDRQDDGPYTFSGPVALRKLAYEILRTVPARKKP